jgi:hypothetical protein
MQAVEQIVKATPEERLEEAQVALKAAQRKLHQAQTAYALAEREHDAAFAAVMNPPRPK